MGRVCGSGKMRRHLLSYQWTRHTLSAAQSSGWSAVRADVFEKAWVVRYGKYTPTPFLSGSHTWSAATHWGPDINLARLPRMGCFPFTMSLRHLSALKGRGTGTAGLQPQARAHRLPISTRSSLLTSPARRSHQPHEFPHHHPRERKVSTPLITPST